MKVTNDEDAMDVDEAPMKVSKSFNGFGAKKRKFSDIDPNYVQSLEKENMTLKMNKIASRPPLRYFIFFLVIKVSF